MWKPYSSSMDYQKESFLKHTENNVQLFVSLAGGKQQSCNLYPGNLNTTIFQSSMTFLKKSTGEKIFLDSCGPQEVSHGFLEGG